MTQGFGQGFGGQQPQQDQQAQGFGQAQGGGFGQPQQDQGQQAQGGGFGQAQGGQQGGFGQQGGGFGGQQAQGGQQQGGFQQGGQAQGGFQQGGFGQQGDQQQGGFQQGGFGTGPQGGQAQGGSRAPATFSDPNAMGIGSASAPGNVEFVKLNEVALGEIVVLRLHGVDLIDTKFGQKDRLNYDLLIITGQNAGSQYEGQSAMNMRVIKAGRDSIARNERFLVGRVNQVPTNQGQPAVQLEPVTDQELAQAAQGLVSVGWATAAELGLNG